MRLRKLFPILSFIALLAIAGTSSPSFALDQSSLLQDMARLDQAYIPVLALTSQGNLPAARQSISRLRERWDDFDVRYRATFPSDPEWSAGFDRADEAIAHAERLVAAGDNLRQAHEELETVRRVFLRLRRSHDIDYFPDYLTAYHDPMEAIVLSAKGKAPRELTQDDRKLMRTRLHEALELWQPVEKADFDPTLFGVSSRQSEWVREQVKTVSQTLEELDRTLIEGSNDQVLEKALALKRPFAKLYMLFGSFGSAL